jgi:hypothetical protein
MLVHFQICTHFALSVDNERDQESHNSAVMYSIRLLTLAFASAKSCFTKTGPISLNTLASSSKSSSSCQPVTDPFIIKPYIISTTIDQLGLAVLSIITTHRHGLLSGRSCELASLLLPVSTLKKNDKNKHSCEKQENSILKKRKKPRKMTPMLPLV